jgi:IclR family transcriptional regulator, mhp operon transcriptional activator
LHVVLHDRAPLLGTSRGMAFLAFCDPKSRAQALAASDDPWNAVVHDP